MSLRERDKSSDHRLEFVQQVDTNTGLQYSIAYPGPGKTQFAEIATCLNLVIFKSFDKSQIYQHAANEVFGKDARVQLSFASGEVLQSLEIVRGYCYTIKPGMGNIISTSTSPRAHSSDPHW